MSIVDSHWCTFCKISEEPLENRFTHCAIFSAFWLSVVEWLENYFPATLVLTDVKIMLGLFGKLMQLISHIVLIGKHAIFQRRNVDVHSSLSLLEAKPKKC